MVNKPGKIVCVLLMAAAFASGDAINGTGSWQSAAPNQTGTPFWANPSGDGPQCGVGYVLTGSSNATYCSSSLNALTSPLSYFGNGTAAPTNLYFTANPTGYMVTLDGVFTNAPDQIGWYSTTDPSHTVNWLLSTATTLGVPIFFNPCGGTCDFGLVEGPGAVVDTWYSDTSLSSSGAEYASLGSYHQHFAAFQVTAGISNYYLGVEDGETNWVVTGTAYTTQNGSVSEGGGDYNDLVLQLQTVPEPATLGFVGLGLMALLGARRLRRRP